MACFEEVIGLAAAAKIQRIEWLQCRCVAVLCSNLFKLIDFDPHLVAEAESVEVRGSRGAGLVGVDLMLQLPGWVVNRDAIIHGNVAELMGAQCRDGIDAVTKMVFAWDRMLLA